MEKKIKEQRDEKWDEHRQKLQYNEKWHVADKNMQQQSSENYAYVTGAP